MGLNTDWLDEIFTKTPEESWNEIFDYLLKLVGRQSGDFKTVYRTLESEIGFIDHILASSAWDLWENFSIAPKASAEVIRFWNETIGPKAVLLLDSMSIREVVPICGKIKEIGLNVNSIVFAGSEAPSETDLYANALGLNGRSDLAKKSVPGKFALSTEGTYVDTFKKIPFDETATKIPNEKNIFVWHGWPDDALHDMGKVDDAFNRFISHVKEQFESEGFKNLIKTLARGRTLLITSDHGYCDTSGFQMAQNDENKELKTLGHTRAKPIKEDERYQGRTIPPATLEMHGTSSNDLYRIALGRRRPSDRGFPALTHGGLSLLECTVPLITVAENG